MARVVRPEVVLGQAPNIATLDEESFAGEGRATGGCAWCGRPIRNGCRTLHLEPEKMLPVGDHEVCPISEVEGEQNRPLLRTRTARGQPIDGGEFGPRSQLMKVGSAQHATQ